jgi:Methyltransferase domain
MEVETDPDDRWVADLAGCSLAAARGVLDEASREAQLFRHLRMEHLREGRSSYIEIIAPLELYAFVRLLKPSHVVEVGVSSGVSSAYLLQALERNGRGTLHSIDRPKVAPARPASRRSSGASWSLPPGRSSGWAVPDRLRGRWDLRIGDKKDVIPLLAEELDGIDFFVYDVPHDDARSRAEFRALDPRVPAGGIALADHGPGGGRCRALAWWARHRGGVPVGRHDLGLFGFRARKPAPGFPSSGTGRSDSALRNPKKVLLPGPPLDLHGAPAIRASKKPVWLHPASSAME